jgi:hypothetical protein
MKLGTCKHSVNLASGKYAITENAKEFVLVPWKPSLEDIEGQGGDGFCRFESQLGVRHWPEAWFGPVRSSVVTACSPSQISHLDTKCA